MKNSGKIHVVLADDRDCIRAGIRRILQCAGDILLIGEASNGEDAIRLVEHIQPDIILLDIEMPVLDGIEAGKIIKARFPAVHIIFISCYCDPLFLRTVCELCDAGYIIKDEAPATLVSSIRAASGKSISLMQSGNSHRFIGEVDE